MRGSHDLKNIFEVGNDMESTVVRWCKNCGSITIDTDYDGRTNPGDVMSMRSPPVTRCVAANKN